MERLTKSKESALLEAERILRSALERALIVEEVQNHNFELRRQIEICQDENKFLEKINRQKVLEIEKLSQSIVELEEAILAGGTAANAVRDYRRQISQLNASVLFSNLVLHSHIYFISNSHDCFNIYRKRREPWRESWPELKYQQVEWPLPLLTSGKMRTIESCP